VEPQPICEGRYEDLVRVPLAQMRRDYQHLDLGDFDPVAGAVEAYLGQRTDYPAQPLPAYTGTARRRCSALAIVHAEVRR
jgi:hypothetical protein